MKCPLCGEYEGTSQQVQAHISSKKDSAHKGKTGREVLNGQESGSKPGQNGQQGPTGNPSGRPAAGSNGQQGSRPGRETRGTALDVPEIACKKCGRKIAYPELMPYKMSCPGCKREMRKRDAAEKMEEKADEKGKDETVETVEA